MASPLKRGPTRVLSLPSAMLSPCLSFAIRLQLAMLPSSRLKHILPLSPKSVRAIPPPPKPERSRRDVVLCVYNTECRILCFDIFSYACKTRFSRSLSRFCKTWMWVYSSSSSAVRWPRKRMQIMLDTVSYMVRVISRQIDAAWGASTHSKAVLLSV